LDEEKSRNQKGGKSREWRFSQDKPGSEVVGTEWGSGGRGEEMKLQGSLINLGKRGGFHGKKRD